MSIHKVRHAAYFITTQTNIMLVDTTKIVLALVFAGVVTGVVISAAVADHAVATVSITQSGLDSECGDVYPCFSPSTVTIDIGGEITWLNNDAVPRAIIGGMPSNGLGSFNSGPIPPGSEFSFKFEVPGIYPYYSAENPHVVGTVIVQSVKSASQDTSEYAVTITNIMPGQPITPPLLVTHSEDVSIFTVGEKADALLQQLAENGNFGPLKSSLTELEGVHDVVNGTAILVPATDPGNTGIGYTEIFIINAGKAKSYLSFVSMLVCTNDGFVGIDGVQLPSGGTVTLYADVYDAQTEENTEDFADMVPLCPQAIGVSSTDTGTDTTDVTLAENGIVIPHPGIASIADLTHANAWTNPAVKIVIARIG